MHRDFKNSIKIFKKLLTKKKQVFHRKHKQNDDALFPWFFDPVRWVQQRNGNISHTWQIWKKSTITKNKYSKMEQSSLNYMKKIKIKIGLISSKFWIVKKIK